LLKKRKKRRWSEIERDKEKKFNFKEKKLFTRRHNIQHNDTQQNETQLNVTQHNDTKQNDTRHNDKQQRTLSIMILRKMIP
jgi:hypothetical protein